MVGVATFLLGVLPTVQQIGIAAPIIFVLLRLVQGIFVGGVTAYTGTVGVEAVPDRWRGLMSGVVGGGGGGIGGMLAAFVFWITTSCMSNAEYEQWGWRILFFTSILSSFMGFMVARKLEESPVWTALAEVKQLRGGTPGRSPLSLLFSKQHFRGFLANLPLIIAAGAGYYLTSGYLPSYLKVALHLPNEKVSVILSVASIAALCASLFVGHMSQVFGRRSVFLGIGVFRLLALPACCLLMTKTDNLLLLCLLAALFGSCGNAAYAPLVFLNERFPTAMRATGVGFSWSVGFAIGGRAPTFTVLAARTPAQLPISLTAFLVGTSILYLIGGLLVPETRGRINTE